MYLCSFEAKEKKYRLVEQGERRRGRKMRSLKFDLTSNHESRLPKYVQDLVKEMVDVTSLEATVSRAGVDTDILPFGRIKRETLEKAQAVLNQLKCVLCVMTSLCRHSMSGHHISCCECDYLRLLLCF